MNPPADSSVVVVTSDGLEITGSNARRIRWADVERVSAGRLPTADEDQLSLRFQLRGGENFQVSEDIAGFTQLVVLLPELLPGFPESNEWLYDVDEESTTDEQILYQAASSHVPGMNR